MIRSLALLGLLGLSQAFHFKETFDSTWASRWKDSSFKATDGTRGEFTLTAGKFYGDAEEDKGIQTGPDARFFTTYAEMPKTVSNKDSPLVLQFSVKHEQTIDCGGGYIKLLPESSGPKMPDFGGDTPYAIMFGPDICGYATKRIHVILTHKGENHLINKADLNCETDTLTHVYTLVINPDKTYKVLVDLEEKASGSIFDDWDMLPPRTIKDPEATKPEDWDDRVMIPDPMSLKPDDWDDEPAQIADPEASKPDDWDDEEDGEWEAPMIKNPEYKGEWEQDMMENPAYKGRWEAPLIDNPDFVEDLDVATFTDLKYVGFELWQVKAGTIFDNIMVTDDLEEAKQFALDTWGKSKDVEKELSDEWFAEQAELQAAASQEGFDMGDSVPDEYLDEYDDEEEYDDDDDVGHDEL